jgi:hypothetical protein
MHWGQIGHAQVWPSITIPQLFAEGFNVDEVKDPLMVKSIIEIYTLLYEADKWEKRSGHIEITRLQEALVDGKLPMLPVLVMIVAD